MKKISVIIVNFNGKKYLEDCLNSILKNNYPDLEIIVVDNNSTDGSPNLVKKKFPNVILVEEKTNHGFAGGNNIGYKYSTGEIIVLLNNDTKVELDFFKKMIKVFEEIPNCAVAQSKIVLYDNPELIDSAGSFWNFTTFMYHFGYLKNSSNKEFNIPYKIFSAKGASMFIRKEVIEELGLFDEEFWHYYEETDFCHRVINSGKEVWYYPKATCFHKIGISRNTLNQEEKIIFTYIRNKFISYYKNFLTFDLISVLFRAYLFLLGTIFLLLVRKDFKSVKIYSKALLWSFTNIKTLLRKRNENKFKGSEKLLTSKSISLLFYIYPDMY